MPTNKMTRLEAVNTILRSVGEAPVASLTGQSGVDSIMAEATLDEVDRSVQNIGWTWNRRKVTLAKDGTGTIPVADNIVRIIAARGTHYSVRGGNLFDLNDGTATFTGDVTARVVELLPWTDLPEAARHYITVKAARKYADQSIGDNQLSRFTRQDEAEAYAAIRKDEIVRGKYTAFAPEDRSFVDRGSPLSWID